MCNKTQCKSGLDMYDQFCDNYEVFVPDIIILSAYLPLGHADIIYTTIVNHNWTFTQLLTTQLQQLVE